MSSSSSMTITLGALEELGAAGKFLFFAKFLSRLRFATVDWTVFGSRRLEDLAETLCGAEFCTDELMVFADWISVPRDEGLVDLANGEVGRVNCLIVGIPRTFGFWQGLFLPSLGISGVFSATNRWSRAYIDKTLPCTYHLTLSNTPLFSFTAIDWIFLSSCRLEIGHFSNSASVISVLPKHLIVHWRRNKSLSLARPDKLPWISLIRSGIAEKQFQNCLLARHLTNTISYEFFITMILVTKPNEVLLLHPRLLSSHGTVQKILVTSDHHLPCCNNFLLVAQLVALQVKIFCYVFYHHPNNFLFNNFYCTFSK